jgi:hypothetical protein
VQTALLAGAAIIIIIIIIIITTIAIAITIRHYGHICMQVRLHLLPFT